MLIVSITTQRNSPIRYATILPGSNARMILLLLMLVSSLHHVTNTFIDGKYSECSPQNDVCEYWLTIEAKLSMIYNKWLVYAKNSNLYKYNEFPENYTTQIPVEKVITTDGYYRTVIAVNGTIPGPPIIVYEHQTVVVHVKNGLLSDAVTIHWHGIHQQGTPFMDGASLVTQCPIAASQTFTYEFKAKPKGTMWYHGHAGAKRMNGVFGAFIVKKRPKQKVNPPIDMIMSVGDWDHQSAEDIFTKAHGGFFEDRKLVNGVPWVGGLIEGRGRYTDKQTGKRSEAPLSIYKITAGSIYRFRVINFGATYSLRISVDHHNITVVATDGYDVKPYNVESFIATPGERFDFLLTAGQAVDNYWIRATMVKPYTHTISGGSFHVEAVLHYDGAPVGEPTTSRDNCTSQQPCHVLSCPFLYYPANENITCHLITELEDLEEKPAPPYENDSEEHFMNFHLPGPFGEINPGAVNGRIFQYTGVNSLFQHEEIDGYNCSTDNCGVDKVCKCNHELTVPLNKTIQLVFVNVGIGGLIGHPIHLHGHSFSVLKLEYLNSTTYPLFLINKFTHDHLDCGNTTFNYCNDPQWKNRQWENGNVPGLNLRNPIQKDTLHVPPGAYAVVRFRSDNPGKWFIHCHMEDHVLNGMGMVIVEGIEHIPKPPFGFPVCQNFHNNPAKDFDYERKDKINKVLDKDCSSDDVLIIVTVVLSGVILLQFIAILCVVNRIQKPAHSSAVTLHENPNVAK